MKVGFLGLLTLLFIGLKLGEIITWSWLWVLSPLWLPFTLIIIVAAIWAIISGVIGAATEAKNSTKEYDKRKHRSF